MPPGIDRRSTGARHADRRGEDLPGHGPSGRTATDHVPENGRPTPNEGGAGRNAGPYPPGRLRSEPRAPRRCAVWVSEAPSPGGDEASVYPIATSRFSRAER